MPGIYALAGGGSGGGGASDQFDTLVDTTPITFNGAHDGGFLQTLSQDSLVSNPTGTPDDGHDFVLRIKSSSSRALTWDTQFRGSVDTPLPTATSGSSLTDYLGFRWNDDDSKWDYVAENMGF